MICVLRFHLRRCHSKYTSSPVLLSLRSKSMENIVFRPRIIFSTAVPPETNPLHFRSISTLGLLSTTVLYAYRKRRYHTFKASIAQNMRLLSILRLPNSDIQRPYHTFAIVGFSPISSPRLVFSALHGCAGCTNRHNTMQGPVCSPRDIPRHS